MENLLLREVDQRNITMGVTVKNNNGVVMTAKFRKEQQSRHGISYSRNLACAEVLGRCDWLSYGSFHVIATINFRVHHTDKSRETTPLTSQNIRLQNWVKYKSCCLAGLLCSFRVIVGNICSFIRVHTVFA